MPDADKINDCRPCPACGGAKAYAGRRILVAGVRQVLRALEAGTVDTVFLAADAEPKLQARVREACGRCGAAVIEAESMHALGQACGLGVGAACAGAAPQAARR